MHRLVPLFVGNIGALTLLLEFFAGIIEAEAEVEAEVEV